MAAQMCVFYVLHLGDCSLVFEAGRTAGVGQGHPQHMSDLIPCALSVSMGPWVQVGVGDAGVWLQPPHLTQWPVELPEDALLIKHLPLVPVFIVIVDFLAEISRQLVEGHVLFYLLVLKGGEQDQCLPQRQAQPGATQLGDPSPCLAQSREMTSPATPKTNDVFCLEMGFHGAQASLKCWGDRCRRHHRPMVLGWNSGLHRR